MHTRRQLSTLIIAIATGGCISTFRTPRASVAFYNNGTKTHRVQAQFRNAETGEIVYEREESFEVGEGERTNDVLSLREELVVVTSLNGSVVDERNISNGFSDVRIYINQDDEVEVELTVR